MSIFHKTYRRFTNFKCKRNKYSWTIGSFYKARLLTSEKKDYKDEHNKIEYNFYIKHY